MYEPTPIIDSRYVRPEDRDSSYYIFREKFRCRVPFIQTRSLDDIKFFGVPISDTPELNQCIMNELVDRMYSIAEMATMYSEGATIRIVNREDTKRIYEYVSSHIAAWNDKVLNEVNNRDAPVEDLIKLDKFAFAIYEHAKYLLSTNLPESYLTRQLHSSRANRNMLAPAPTVAERESAIPDRVSQIGQAFKRSHTAAGGFKRKGILGGKDWD